MAVINAIRAGKSVFLAKFPHSSILHYSYSPLLKENSSANNRLPLELRFMHLQVCFLCKSAEERFRFLVVLINLALDI